MDMLAIFFAGRSLFNFNLNAPHQDDALAEMLR